MTCPGLYSSHRLQVLQGPGSGRAKRRQQGDGEREAAGTALLWSGASTTTHATQ